ncbi:MAG TPA: ATP phosphoribosyltransferase regulatory subunit [Chloroflexi bacterium]|nr:ATP phosphoribosyltransferase regulatory subunit [Chloroflexota bacterium]
MADYPLRGQLPHGLADLFYEQAAAKCHLEETLQETFRRWGYTRIIMPTFEYYETLATDSSIYLQEEMYRLFDREGRVLALRPDMTVATARVAGTRLYDQPLPLRFFYVGNVFRYEEPQAGRRREFTQAGIELVGAGTPEADAEVLAVAVAALRALGIERFQINLGQVAFLKGILEDISLTNGELSRLERVIGRKNDVELARTLADMGIDGSVTRAIMAIPHLCGGPEILSDARGLTDNEIALQALDRLEQIYDLLTAEGVDDYVTLDLGEVRSMAYYTGITFQGYVEGLGFHVCSGGRYDGLVGQFGRDLPAVGFALGVERAMLVTQPEVDIAPDILMEGCEHTDCRALAARARALGLVVEVDVQGRTGEALSAYGRTRGARRIVSCCDGRAYNVDDGRGEIYTLTRDEIEQEVATWSR